MSVATAKAPLTVRQVRDARVADHAEMVTHSFRDHRVTEYRRSPCGRFGSWRCGSPRRVAHSFYLTAEPGTLFVTGDVGDLIVERTTDMLAFARTSIGDIDYFAGKVVSAIKTREFDPDVLRAWFDEEEQEAAQDEGQLASLKEARRVTLRALDDGDGHDACRALYESGYVDGCDFPDFDNWSYNFLWCRQAIRWRVRHAGADVPGGVA